MKEILILGTGCAKCEKLYENVRQAAALLGMQCNIQKITDIQEIMKHGVVMTPGLVIDGEIKLTGKVPSVDELKNMLA
ncbi:MAG: thioredoxin family protein [Candidatus Zixiibacteriota bacterium]|nr:MAG: thioredoxin family protein [candidate division Zixibacteria bacterium]